MDDSIKSKSRESESFSIKFDENTDLFVSTLAMVLYFDGDGKSAPDELISRFDDCLRDGASRV